MIRRHHTSIVFVLLLLLACGGGDGGGPTNPSPAAVASVVVTPGAVSLNPGQSSQLSASPRDASGNTLSGRTVEWTTSAPAVATVSATGRVTAVATGSALITATSEGRSGMATVAVATAVATVDLNLVAAAVVPLQTVQLTATPRDAGGAALNDRTVEWSTDDAGVATVSANGLVTGVGPGQVDITATVEGQERAATVTVNEGGFVGAEGGTVTTSDGRVELQIPAGAVGAPTAFSISAQENPAPPPANEFLVEGAVYTFGPAGTAFGAPVTVSIEYGNDDLPAWVLPGDISMFRFDGANWNELGNVTVDTGTRTVTGETTGFSDAAVTIQPPQIQISPQPGQINQQQRSVTFTATVGEHDPALFTFNWVTTGTNGSLGAQFDNTIQYTGSTPFLPSGQVDLVGVEAIGSISGPDGPLVSLSRVTAEVNATLQRSFELNPSSTVVEFGEQAQFEAVIRLPDGSIWDGSGLKYEWSFTENTGTLDPGNGTETTTPTADFTAHEAGDQIATDPPRGDRIDVTFFQETQVHNGSAFMPSPEIVRSDIGTATAFVEVAPDTYVGRFQVVVEPNGTGGGCAFARVFQKKIDGATNYMTKVTGFKEGDELAPEWTKDYAGPTGDGTGFNDVFNGGSELSMNLAGGCNSLQFALDARVAGYQERFSGIDIATKVTVPDEGN